MSSFCGSSKGGIDWESLARAETHPLRVCILELLDLDGGRTLAPRELAYELQNPLPRISYHTKELHKARLIRLTHEHEVGGVIEHFYCLPHHSADDLIPRLKAWRADYA